MILLDREFYSVDVMCDLDSLGVQYLISCINRTIVVNVLRDCVSRKHKAILRIAMSDSDKEVSYYVVTDKKRQKKSKSDAPEDRFIVFATNVLRVDAVKYGKRHGIEIGYKMNTWWQRYSVKSSS